MPVAEYPLEHALPYLTTLLDTILLHARLSKPLLRLLEPPDTGAGGDAGIEEEASSSDGEGDDAVDDEDPSPTISKTE